MYLGIKHDSSLFLNPCDKNKSFLYNWPRNWRLTEKLRLIHLRNLGLCILVGCIEISYAKKEIIFMYESEVWWKTNPSNVYIIILNLIMLSKYCYKFIKKIFNLFRLIYFLAQTTQIMKLFIGLILLYLHYKKNLNYR